MSEVVSVQVSMDGEVNERDRTGRGCTDYKIPCRLTGVEPSFPSEDLVWFGTGFGLEQQQDPGRTPDKSPLPATVTGRCLTPPRFG